MGFPFEHGLRSTLIAMRLADRLGVDRGTRWQTYYACLLSDSGCTTDAHVTPEVYGDSLTTHFHPVRYRAAVSGGRAQTLAFASKRAVAVQRERQQRAPPHSGTCVPV